MLNCLLVGAGGFLGSVCRYLMGLLPLKSDAGFPVTTLLINVLGAFCIGLVVALAERSKLISPQALLFLKVGVCGGFTTFSTFAYELGDLLSSGRAAMGVAYALLSAVLGVLAVYCGMALGR